MDLRSQGNNSGCATKGSKESAERAPLLAAEVVFGKYTMNVGNWIACYDVHAICQGIKDGDAD